MNKRNVEFVKKLITTVVMIFLSILMVVPFLWMLSASLKNNNDVFNFPIEWIPKEPTLVNYKAVWASQVPFYIYYWNSLKTTIFGVVAAVLTSCLTGYAFAKMNFKGKNIAFLLYLATLMFPNQVMLIPKFIMFKFMGLYDSQWSLMLPWAFSAFGTFLLKQFFSTIPNELSESARIDGCNNLRILFRIVVPLSKPAISALIIYLFVMFWNSYEDPLVFLTTKNLFTIPLGLLQFQDENRTDTAAIMAASVSALVPVFTVFLSAQKYFIEGIALTGIKG